MKFEDFKVPPRYANANINNCNQLPKELVDHAKTWLSNPKRESIVFSGTPGSGKTYLGFAIFRELCNLYHWPLWVNSERLDQEILNAQRDMYDSPDRVMDKYKEAHALVWDDLGTERNNERVQRQYYSIIDFRLNNDLPTIFSTNFDEKQVGEYLGERIASRLKACEWIIFPKRDIRVWKANAS